MKALYNIEHQGFERINDAFRTICKDKIGKEAIQEAVKKILLKNISDPDAKKLELKDGTLTLTCAWGNSGYFTDQYIQKQIESML